MQGRLRNFGVITARPRISEKIYYNSLSWRISHNSHLYCCRLIRSFFAVRSPPFTHLVEGLPRNNWLVVNESLSRNHGCLVCTLKVRNSDVVLYGFPSRDNLMILWTRPHPLYNLIRAGDRALNHTPTISIYIRGCDDFLFLSLGLLFQLKFS